MMDSNIFGVPVADMYIRRPVLRDISDSPMGRGMQIANDVHNTSPIIKAQHISDFWQKFQIGAR